MADFVQQRLEEMVPDLQDMEEKRIFTHEELRSIVARRRDFEYRVASAQNLLPSRKKTRALSTRVNSSSNSNSISNPHVDPFFLCNENSSTISPSPLFPSFPYNKHAVASALTAIATNAPSPSPFVSSSSALCPFTFSSSTDDRYAMEAKSVFLDYAKFEMSLECLRRHRSQSLGWRKKSSSDYAAAGQLHSIFGRAVRIFPEDMSLWFQYIDFCLHSGSPRSLKSVVMRALRYHPHDARLWILASERELKEGNLCSARTLMLRALRNGPQNMKIWIEYLRLEAMIINKFLITTTATTRKDRREKWVENKRRKVEEEIEAAAGQTEEEEEDKDGGGWEEEAMVLQNELNDSQKNQENGGEEEDELQESPNEEMSSLVGVYTLSVVLKNAMKTLKEAAAREVVLVNAFNFIMGLKQTARMKAKERGGATSTALRNGRQTDEETKEEMEEEVKMAGMEELEEILWKLIEVESKVSNPLWIVLQWKVKMLSVATISGKNEENERREERNEEEAKKAGRMWECLEEILREVMNMKGGDRQSMLLLLFCQLVDGVSGRIYTNTTDIIDLWNADDEGGEREGNGEDWGFVLDAEGDQRLAVTTDRKEKEGDRKKTNKNRGDEEEKIVDSRRQKCITFHQLLQKTSSFNSLKTSPSSSASSSSSASVAECDVVNPEALRYFLELSPSACHLISLHPSLVDICLLRLPSPSLPPREEGEEDGETNNYDIEGNELTTQGLRICDVFWNQNISFFSHGGRQQSDNAEPLNSGLKKDNKCKKLKGNDDGGKESRLKDVSTPSSSSTSSCPSPPFTFLEKWGRPAMVSSLGGFWVLRLLDLCTDAAFLQFSPAAMVCLMDLAVKLARRHDGLIGIGSDFPGRGRRKGGELIKIAMEVTAEVVEEVLIKCIHEFPESSSSLQLSSSSSSSSLWPLPLPVSPLLQFFYWRTVCELRLLPGRISLKSMMKSKSHEKSLEYYFGSKIQKMKKMMNSATFSVKSNFFFRSKINMSKNEDEKESLEVMTSADLLFFVRRLPPKSLSSLSAIQRLLQIAQIHEMYCQEDKKESCRKGRKPLKDDDFLDDDDEDSEEEEEMMMSREERDSRSKQKGNNNALRKYVVLNEVFQRILFSSSSELLPSVVEKYFEVCCRMMKAEEGKDGKTEKIGSIKMREKTKQKEEKKKKLERKTAANQRGGFSSLDNFTNDLVDEEEVDEEEEERSRTDEKRIYVIILSSLLLKDWISPRLPHDVRYEVYASALQIVLKREEENYRWVVSLMKKKGEDEDEAKKKKKGEDEDDDLHAMWRNTKRMSELISKCLMLYETGLQIWKVYVECVVSTSNSTPRRGGKGQNIIIDEKIDKKSKKEVESKPNIKNMRLYRNTTSSSPSSTSFEGTAEKNVRGRQKSFWREFVRFVHSVEILASTHMPRLLDFIQKFRRSPSFSSSSSLFWRVGSGGAKTTNEWMTAEALLRRARNELKDGGKFYQEVWMEMMETKKE